MMWTKRWMIDSVALPRLLVSLIGLSAMASPVRAELVRLAEMVQAPASEIAGKLKAATAVVCVRSSGRTQLTWPATRRDGNRVDDGAARAGVEAFPASADERLEALSNLTTPFTASDAKRAAASETQYLVGGTLQTSETPVLRVVIWQLDRASLVWTKDYPLRPESLDLQVNVPELNRGVVAYCQANLDRAVGTGECLDLAAAALQAAGTKRQGIYTWGRELAARNRSSRATSCKFVDWSGDPQRLSVDLPYAVPNEQWLFLAAWNSHFAISEFTLEDNSDRKP